MRLACSACFLICSLDPREGTHMYKTNCHEVKLSCNGQHRLDGKRHGGPLWLVAALCWEFLRSQMHVI